MASWGRPLCSLNNIQHPLNPIVRPFKRVFSTENPSGVSQLTASVILNRSPILTPIPSPFEKAYYSYQSNVARAISNPFPTDFYFKKGSQLQRRFEQEEKNRELQAFGVGLEEARRLRAEKTNAKAKSAAKGSKNKNSQEAAPSTVENVDVETDTLEEEPPADRISEADRSGDLRNLNRRGERNLYLLVKTAQDPNIWRFPQGTLEGEEPLHTAALRQLHVECGPDMDTWIVSRHPIGFHEVEQPTPSKIFFFKGHILKGQANPDPKQISDFAWLSKEEIEGRLDGYYWKGVKDMLSDF